MNCIMMASNENPFGPSPKAVQAEIKMGRQPRSGDIPWLSAHSILNWIGGDVSMLAPFWRKSRFFPSIFVPDGRPDLGTGTR